MSLAVKFMDGVLSAIVAPASGSNMDVVGGTESFVAAADVVTCNTLLEDPWFRAPSSANTV